MIKGISFALAACFIWGLIFIVPQFMDGFTAIEVALGRYLFYGVISVAILFKAFMQGSCRYPLSIWKKALYFSLASSIGYYTFVVLSLRYATPAICALVLGIAPITIAFYANWKHKEISYRSLILPSLLILIGLTIINAPHFSESESQSEYALGLICSFVALLSWSWFVVANAQFLKSYPEVASSDWSTLIGVMTLFWVVVSSLVFGFIFTEQLELEKYSTMSSELLSFLIGCAILGLLCSWLGAFLWNRASYYLPVSLAGQLTIFETIFGLLFVYLLEQRIPPQFEFLGIALLLAAIIYGIRASSKAIPQEI